MSSARTNILRRLQANQVSPLAENHLSEYQYNWPQDQKINRLTEKMTAVRTEVHHLHNESWIDWLNRELPSRGLHNILVGTNEFGNQYIEKADESLNIQQYEKAIDDWKHELFHDIDAGITTTKGAIAETGSLILWPDKTEPRLMSLVPPTHIALLHANEIDDTFLQTMDRLNWSENTPTNALLISGPSKTSDIEQTLAFGIHGPKELIVLIN